MNISSLDLNLLLVFEALLEERNVSRAAVRIGLSQPAMSNALGRLRAILGDPLFTRTGRGMMPSARAVELAGPVRAGLAQLRRALEGRQGFDPASSTRTFRLAFSDYAEMRLLGPLLARVQKDAPEVQILIRRVDQIFAAPETELRAGTFDAAIGFFPEVSALEPGTCSRDLFQEDNVVIARKGHPLMRKPLTAQRFASAGHLGIFYRSESHGRSESRGLIDNLLAGRGLRRRLQATTPHFLTAPYLVAESDLIACVPEGLAARFRKVLPLEVRKMPIPMPPLHMRLLWHEHVNDDPAQEWLRSLI